MTLAAMTTWRNKIYSIPRLWANGRERKKKKSVAHSGKWLSWKWRRSIFQSESKATHRLRGEYGICMQWGWPQSRAEQGTEEEKSTYIFHAHGILLDNNTEMRTFRLQYCALWSLSIHNGAYMFLQKSLTQTLNGKHLLKWKFYIDYHCSCVCRGSIRGKNFRSDSIIWERILLYCRTTGKHIQDFVVYIIIHISCCVTLRPRIVIFCIVRTKRVFTPLCSH